ncbi:flagella basal body P-ring formation protein FlgA [Sphingomonas sp. RS6]
MLLAAMLFAAPAFQSTALLDTIVAQFTGHEIGEEGGARAPVDPRLKLAPCPAPQLDWRSEAHDAVVIRCVAPGWRVYVPVRSAERAQPQPAAARPAVPVKAALVIRRGDPITVEARAAGFAVTREGQALGDAVAGARLLVRIDDKRSPIQAIAVEPGRARLPGFDE